MKKSERQVEVLIESLIEVSEIEKVISSLCRLSAKTCGIAFWIGIEKAIEEI